MLADNLRRLLLGRPLRPFRPQSSYLSIITTGGQHAVAIKGWLVLEVRLVQSCSAVIWAPANCSAAGVTG